MTTVELIQTGLALVGVAGIGGVWFKLGSLVGIQQSHAQRITRLENRVFMKETEV